MKYANKVRRAIVQKNKTLGISMDVTQATEERESLDPFIETYCKNKTLDKMIRFLRRIFFFKRIEDEKADMDKKSDENKKIGDSDASEKNTRFEFTTNARFQASYLDIFVEDAICHLSTRARTFYIMASLCIGLAIAVLAGGVKIIIDNRPSVTADIGTAQLILKIFSSLAIGGLVLVAAKGLLSLIRAFLHEATRLLERRHALRFGKLFLYLQLGYKFESINLTLKDIQEAFQWNKETSTAFLDMKPEAIAETVINQLARMPSSMLERVFGRSNAEKNKDTETDSKK